MEIAPPGTVDPTPSLYNLTMYLMAALLALALVCKRADAAGGREASDAGPRSRRARSDSHRAAARSAVRRRAARVALASCAAAVLSGCSRAGACVPAPGFGRKLRRLRRRLPSSRSTRIPTFLSISRPQAVDPFDAILQINLQKMSSGGLDAAFFIVYVRANGAHRRELRAGAGGCAHEVHSDSSDGRSAVSRTHRDCLSRRPTSQRHRSAGKLVAAIGIENGYRARPGSRDARSRLRCSARATSRSCTTATTISRARRNRNPSSATATMTTRALRRSARSDRAHEPRSASWWTSRTARTDGPRRDAAIAAPVIASHSGVAGLRCIRATWTTRRCSRCATTAE